MSEETAGTPSISKHDWETANPAELEYFIPWMSALTGQGLHDKSDIAIVFALFEREVAALTTELEAAKRALAEAGEEVRNVGDQLYYAEDHIRDIENDNFFLKTCVLAARSELQKMVVASDRFVADTGMKHGDMITDATESARKMIIALPDFTAALAAKSTEQKEKP